MIRRPLSILCLALLLCSCNGAPSFTRVSYEARFDMATCGNILNPNIYSPDVGPDGFVTYRAYFEKGFSLQLHRDFSCGFSYKVRNSDSYYAVGMYESYSANARMLIVHEETLQFELSWINYYQMKLEWDIPHPESGDLLHAVALLHSTNIFTT